MEVPEIPLSLLYSTDNSKIFNNSMIIVLAAPIKDIGGGKCIAEVLAWSADGFRVWAACSQIDMRLDQTESSSHCVQPL